MLKVRKNSKNNLYVTVTERTTISSANYLLSLFSNDNIDERVVRLPANSSTNTARWDIFSLEEVEAANEDLENGKVNLLAGSTYDYVIYETSGSTGTTITGLNVVEKGLLQVEGFKATGSTYNDSNKTITFQ